MSTPGFSDRRGLLLALAVLGAACQRPSESPQAHAVRVAVQRYNQLLPDAFRTSRADLLGEAASPTEVFRVSSVIAGLAAQGKVMEARQLELTVVEVRLGPEAPSPSATVRTSERWIYRHHFIGAPPGERTEPQEARYRMTYAMVRQGGRWLVEKALIDEE